MQDIELDISFGKHRADTRDCWVEEQLLILIPHDAAIHRFRSQLGKPGADHKALPRRKIKDLLEAEAAAKAARARYMPFSKEGAAAYDA